MGVVTRCGDPLLLLLVPITGGCTLLEAACEVDCTRLATSWLRDPVGSLPDADLVLRPLGSDNSSNRDLVTVSGTCTFPVLGVVVSCSVD